MPFLATLNGHLKPQRNLNQSATMNPESKLEPAIDVSTSVATQTTDKALLPITGKKPEALAVLDGHGIVLSNTDEMMRFAKIVIESGLAPRGIDTPQKAFICLQMGAEVGLPPMSALQNIAPINGRPTLYGDAVPGICNASGLIEDYKDETTGEGDLRCAKVTVKRKGRSEPIVRTFSVADAKKAGLWGKTGPWSQFPDRMLLMRARTFAYRDAVPEKMKGIMTFEEAREIPEKNITHSLSEVDAK
jgi:hypothetical protein